MKPASNPERFMHLGRQRCGHDESCCGPGEEQPWAQFLHDGVVQEFHIDPDAATIDLSPTRVVWRLDHTKAAEISDDLVALSAPRDGGETTGHFYVDMTSPAETLVISRDENTDVAYPWVSPEWAQLRLLATHDGSRRTGSGTR